MILVIQRARQEDGSLNIAFPRRQFSMGDTESASFTVRADGSARLDMIWAGPLVEQFFSDDDHEQWIEFSPSAARELLGMLVWMKFAAEDNPIQSLKNFAEVSGISADAGSWT